MRAIIKAYVGAAIHDGDRLHHGQALAVLADGTFRITPCAALPDGSPIETLTGGTLCPGFVDLQVNGGGGVMFNNAPSVDTLRTIAAAHLGAGSAAILPTLITDTPAQTQAAIDAVVKATDDCIEGIAGLHLEGPHLAQTRKGAHDAALIRPMDNDDLNLLTHTADRIGNLMVTVAPEAVTHAQIRTMADAGITVSLGHTDADFDTCMAAFDAGARAVTHLFNAMSQLTPRAPGLVGATLARGDIYAGLIADGIHVHPATIRMALAARAGADRIFLVTDAMATTGSDITSFDLGGRQVLRADDRLALSDGTLAGAHLTLPRAIAVMSGPVGEPHARAIHRATHLPAQLLRESGNAGRITNATRRAVHLRADGTVQVVSA